MKYVVVLGDGMADWPIESLGGKTPLEYAHTPVMDQLARAGEIGMVHTIPDGMKPGSDTANLSVLGYDPELYYSGRSPLEALSIGVNMKKEDTALRVNLVSLSEEEASYESRRILDHSSDEISTEDAAVLLEAVREKLERKPYRFYAGTSYRHLLLWDHGRVPELTAPHDILGRTVGPYLPKEEDLREMMKQSYEILVRHPLNEQRRKKGQKPANSCWFWGAGTKPSLISFSEKYKVKAAMISAVDLLKGIAAGASMKVIQVEGANGGLHTNYEGKAEAAVDILTKEGYDFVYVHIEAPDEMGHQGSAKKKVQAIEYLDGRVIRPILHGLKEAGEDVCMLILPDHPTPAAIRTHTGDDVPYLLYDSTSLQQHSWKYNEREAAESGHSIAKGHEILDYLLSGYRRKIC